jgi:hypothetical protein
VANGGGRRMAAARRGGTGSCRGGLEKNVKNLIFC